MVGNTISQDLSVESIVILLVQVHWREFGVPRTQFGVPMRSHCDLRYFSRQTLLNGNPEFGGCCVVIGISVIVTVADAVPVFLVTISVTV